MTASHVARAMALAAARLDAAGALARLGGRDGAAARALGDVAALRHELAAARPAGWRLIDPSWLAGPPALPRLAYGACVPMGDHPLVALAPPALLRALSLLGRKQLAAALAGSAPRAIAELAARLPWGRELLADVAGARPDAAARARVTGLVFTDPLALPRAGARAIAHTVDAVPDLAPQLAQRLPRPVGALLLADLRAFVSSPGATAADLAAAVDRAR